MNTMTKYTPELLNDLEAQAMFSSFFYQLGYQGGMDFKMWAAIEQDDFETANEALDSLWAKEQSPERAQRFAEFLRQLG